MKTLPFVLLFSSFGNPEEDPSASCYDNRRNTLALSAEIVSNDPLVGRIFIFDARGREISGELYFGSMQPRVQSVQPLEYPNNTASRGYTLQVVPWIIPKTGFSYIYFDAEKPVPEIPDGTFWRGRLLLRAQTVSVRHPRWAWDCFEVDLYKEKASSGRFVWHIDTKSPH